MIRILVFLLLIGLVTLGLGFLVEQPGAMSLTWFGYHIDTSPLVGLGVVALTAVVVWSLLRFIFNLPGLVALTARARKRARGHEALARGIIAAGVGDLNKARKASQEAKKLVPNEPLALLLDAQTAQLSGDRDSAERAFRAMTEKHETRLLGLRGLHAEIPAPGRSRSRPSDRAAGPEHRAPRPGRARRCSTVIPGSTTGRRRVSASPRI